MQGYYLEEYGRLVGLELKSRVVLSTARGERFCEWEHQLAHNPATEASSHRCRPCGNNARASSQW